MNKPVVICGPFRLQDAAAYQGQGILGATPPTATVGLAHALSRDVAGSVTPDLDIPACGVIVHEAELLQGHPKYPPGEEAVLRKGGNKELPGPDVIDEIRLRGIVSFVLVLDHRGDEDDEDGDFERLRLELPRLLLLKRYAGGTLHPAVPMRDLVSPVLAPGDQGKYLRGFRRGFMLRDRSEYLSAQRAQNRPHLDVILEVAALKPREGGGYERVVPGAMTPVSVGYRAIEPVALRETSRGRGPRAHCYADQLSSVGEWTHTRTLSKEDIPFDGCLWRPYVDQSLGLFYASARGPVTDNSQASRRS